MRTFPDHVLDRRRVQLTHCPCIVERTDRRRRELWRRLPHKRRRRIRQRGAHTHRRRRDGQRCYRRGCTRAAGGERSRSLSSEAQQHGAARRHGCCFFFSVFFFIGRVQWRPCSLPHARRHGRQCVCRADNVPAGLCNARTTHTRAPSSPLRRTRAPGQPWASANPLKNRSPRRRGRNWKRRSTARFATRTGRSSARSTGRTGRAA